MISIFPVVLPGSTRSADADIERANAVWSQCSASVLAAGGESWKTDALDQVPPKGVLDECSDVSNPTAEEAALLAYRPGGPGVIHAYYVPSMPRSYGEAFVPSVSPTPQPAIIVGDDALPYTLAHELGHVLMNDGSHNPDPDHLMAGTARKPNATKLNPEDCAKL